MIYLIGGAPRLGKSVLARALMKKTGAPWLSSDALRNAFYAMTPKEKRNILFPCTGAEDNVAVFKKSLAVTVGNQLREAHSIRKGIFGFLQDHLDMESPLILEGVHLMPKNINTFIQKNSKQKKNIRVLYLIDSDHKNVLRGLRANTDSHDWLKGARPTTYEKVAEFIVAFNNKVEQEARECHMPMLVRTSRFQDDMKRCATILIR